MTDGDLLFFERSFLENLLSQGDVFHHLVGLSFDSRRQRQHDTTKRMIAFKLAWRTLSCGLSRLKALESRATTRCMNRLNSSPSLSVSWVACPAGLETKARQDATKKEKTLG